jgi:hydrogenase-4 component B
MGIYGLVRLSGIFERPPVGWGLALLALGVVSAVLGVAFALGQHDLKRLLAYHSVENIGIIVMGLGLALVGRVLDRPALAALGLAGALLHTWNHGLFKALLFLGAGSVIHATGTREIDRLGGLAKKMPKTALAFLIGAVAISGLPPLNGFVSELLIYLGMLSATIDDLGAVGLGIAFGVPALAMVGALAVACFVKVFGVVFLGEPRTAAVDAAHESPRSMLAPMAVLALLCIAIGVAPPLVAPVLARATGAPIAELAPLNSIAIANAILLACLLLIALWLGRSRRRAARTVTWDCGYVAPTPRMQYTASSFAAGLVGLFSFALRPSRHDPELSEPFPKSTRFESHVPEVVLDLGIGPAVAWLARQTARLRFLQQGNLQLYLLYVLATLIVLLVVWR